MRFASWVLDALFAAALAYVTVVVATGGFDLRLAGQVVSSHKVIVPGLLVWVFGIAAGLVRRARGAGRALPDDAAAGPSRATAWLIAAALVFVTLARAIGRPFVMDDLMMVASARSFSSAMLANMLRGVGWSTVGFVRPLPELMWWVEWKLHACTPLYCHLANLGLHLANVWLVGAIAARLIPGGRLAPFAMLVFAVAGTHAEPLLWLSSRYDLLAATFGLAATAAWLAWLDTRRGSCLAAALAALALAQFCKESALALPLGLAGLAFVHGPPGARRLRAALPALAVLALTLIYRVIMLEGRAAGAHQDWMSADKLAITPLSPLPPLTWPVNMDQVADLAAPARALIALMLALVPLAAVRRVALGPDRATLCACGLLLAATLPVHAVISLAATLKQSRYLYLPAAFYAVLVVEIARAVPARRAALGLTLVVAAHAALLRSNAEPFVATGATVARVLAQAGPVVAALRAGAVVDLRGLPLIYRGAPACQGYTVLIPLVEQAGVSRDALHVQGDEWRDRPTHFDRAFRWDPDRGFAEERP